jgi:ribosomal protein S27E
MSSSTEILILTYFAIGVLLGTFGPAGNQISEEVARTRGSPLTNALAEREQPSELKLALFRVIITVGFILLWPVFIYGIVKDQRDKAASMKAFQDKHAEGLWFQYSMGGGGDLSCNDCSYSEEVTSFIHGISSSSTGFQCQACGRFAAIESGGPGQVNEYARKLVCDCGGPLEREKVVFCPNCRSKNLTYDLRVIT